MHPLLHCILRFLKDKVFFCFLLFYLYVFKQFENCLFSNEAQSLNIMSFFLLGLPLYPCSTLCLSEGVVSQLQLVLASCCKVIEKSTGKSLQRLALKPFINIFSKFLRQSPVGLLVVTNFVPAFELELPLLAEVEPEPKC